MARHPMRSDVDLMPPPNRIITPNVYSAHVTAWNGMHATHKRERRALCAQTGHVSVRVVEHRCPDELRICYRCLEVLD